MKKAAIWWVAGFIVVIAVAVTLAFSAGNNSYVASVNGEKISEDELQEALMAQYGSEAVDALVMEKILEMEIEKEGIEVSQAEIDEEMKTYAEYYGGEEALQEVAETSGIDLSEVEKDLETYLATNKLLEKRIEITEEEMKTYFEENKDQFAQAEQVQASHILVEDEATANEVAKKLAAGGDFAELAKEYSIDEGSSKEGGEVGYFGKGAMVPEFEEAAFSMEKGEVSDPVKSEYGFHIIKVTDKKEAKEANYEESKEEIKSALMESKVQEEYMVWLQEKQEEYDVEYAL
ncbi:peptidylprolyl isomerase [Bacillus thermotolerans]|uniref:Foldase protein PrsA n=1 Tax=Bacillus thermotolerans TaxID=1221996 RepID=A0A0F5I6Y9_BACTR|nr:peptidylprolyl isomerase [Bacillus thermotolerans]KKB40942.1 Foldase protein PrsA precursor [Bacillus thermotolerans]